MKSKNFKRVFSMLLAVIMFVSFNLQVSMDMAGSRHIGIQRVHADTVTKTVQFAESDQQERSLDIDIPDLKNISKVTVNTGNVTYNLDGKKITLNVSKGNPSSSVWNDKKYSKIGTGYYRWPTNQLPFTNYYPYTDSEGYKGNIPTDGNYTSDGGSITYPSKPVSKTLGPQLNSNFPTYIDHNEGGYNGRLYPDGSIETTDKIDTPGDSKTVSEERETAPGGKATDLPNSIPYNKDGYTGTLSKVGTTSSSIPGDSKTITEEHLRAEYYWAEYMGDGHYRNRKKELQSGYYYNDGKYSGNLYFSSEVDGVVDHDTYYYDDIKRPQKGSILYLVLVRYYRSNCTGVVTSAASTVWKGSYTGTVTKPPVTHKEYKQKYSGTVTGSPIDNRMWKQYYKGTVYKGGYDNKYAYTVTIEYTQNNSPVISDTIPSEGIVYNTTSKLIPMVTVSDVDNDLVECGYYLDGIKKDNKSVAITTANQQISFSSLDVGTLANGNHSIKFTVSDGFKLVEKVVNFKVNYPTVISQVAPSNGSIYREIDNSISPNMTIADTDNNEVNCYYKIDNQNEPRGAIKVVDTISPKQVNFNSPINISELSEGNHIIKFYANDGYIDSTKTSDIIIDKSAPLLGSVTINPSTTSITVTGSATDSISGLSDKPYKFFIDSTESDWISSASFTKDSLLPNMQSDISFQAQDKCGHTALSQTYKKYTLAEKPTLLAESVSSKLIKLTVKDNNPEYTKYQIKCGTQYITASGLLSADPEWIRLTNKSILVSGLLLNTEYSFTAKAKNWDNIETDASDIAKATTKSEDSTVKALPDCCNWTNQNVIVEIQFPEDAKEKQYAWNEIKGNFSDLRDYKDKVELTREGEWYLHYSMVDKTGKPVTGYFGPYYVDKTQPGFLGSIYLDKDKKGVLLSYTDFGSGCKIKQYQWATNTDTIPSNLIDYKDDELLPLPEKGTDYIYYKAVDLAGNISEDFFKLGDRHEVNNYKNKDKDNKATPIQLYIDGSEIPEEKTIYQATIHLPTDVDWYEVKAPDYGVLTAIVERIPNSKDYGIEIEASNGIVASSTTKAASYLSSNDTHEENCEIDASPGTYYIKVYPKNNIKDNFDPNNQYELRVNLAPRSGGGGTTDPVATSFIWPTDSHEVTLLSGDIDDQYTVSHSGIDIQGTEGDVVRASCDGKIDFAGLDGDNGNVVRIKTKHNGKEVMIQYSHLKNISADIKVDAAVKAGDTLGSMGRTGSVSLTNSKSAVLNLRITGTNYAEAFGSDLTGGNDAYLSEPFAVSSLPKEVIALIDNPMTTASTEDGGSDTTTEGVYSSNAATDKANARYTKNLDLGSEEVYLRRYVELKGGTVTWDDATKSATVVLDGETIIFKSGQSSAQSTVEEESEGDFHQMAPYITEDIKEFKNNRVVVITNQFKNKPSSAKAIINGRELSVAYKYNKGIFADVKEITSKLGGTTEYAESSDAWVDITKYIYANIEDKWLEFNMLKVKDGSTANVNIRQGSKTGKIVGYTYGVRKDPVILGSVKKLSEIAGATIITDTPNFIEVKYAPSIDKIYSKMIFTETRNGLTYKMHFEPATVDGKKSYILVPASSDDWEKFTLAYKTPVQAGTMASIVIGFTPGDTAKDFVDLVWGKDVFTGEEIDRGLQVVILIAPETIDALIKHGIKNSDGIIAMLKSAKRLDKATAEAIEKVAFEGEKTAGGIIGRISEMTAEEYLRLEKIADDMYATFRNISDDVAKIARNSGMQESDILKIKNHLFNDEHLFNSGVRAKFDPDYEQAMAWDRLMKGTQTETDKLLLNHELYELNYMKANNCTYEVAHAEANKVYNWQSVVYPEP